MNIPPTPKVSIIIPVHNAEKYIHQSMDSILNQTFKNFEIIAVNDGSTDSSFQILNNYAAHHKNIKVLNADNVGVSKALNLALGSASGIYVARCDADDLFPKDRLNWQVEFLNSHPSIGAVCGIFSTINSRNELIRKMHRCSQQGENITDELRAGITRTHLGTFLIRKEIIGKINGFRYFYSCEDIDFQLRLSEACNIWYEPINSYLYRLHDDSITHNVGNISRNYYDNLAREFQKQRLERGNDDLELGIKPPPPQVTGGEPLKAKEHINNLLIGKSWHDHKSGKKIDAILVGIKICLNHPLKISNWTNLLKLILKRAPKPFEK